MIGLLVIGIGLLTSALTPNQPVPWYSRAEVTAELTADVANPGETPPVQEIQIELPDDADNGWGGLIWLLVAMIPISIGGGVLQPSINSIITQRVSPEEVGGTLGISAAFLSGSNAITPLVMGAIFEWMGSSAPFMIGSVILLILWMIAQRTIVKE